MAVPRAGRYWLRQLKKFPPTVQVIDRRNPIMNSIARLTGVQISVGISADSVRAPDPDEPESLTNALVGYVHENGSPADNIPARPFLVPGVKDARAAILVSFRQAADAVLEGKDPTQYLEQAGETAKASVQDKIRTGPFVPLARETVARRKARGFAGDKPLNVTLQLLNSIAYRIKTNAGS